MGSIKFRFAEADHANHKDGDQWFTLDLATLDDLTAGQLIELEGEMNYTVEEMAWGLRRGATKARCAAMWLARRRAGIVEDWETFDPLVRRAEWVEWDEEGDVPPPGPATGASPSSQPGTNQPSTP